MLEGLGLGLGVGLGLELAGGLVLGVAGGLEVVGGGVVVGVAEAGEVTVVSGLGLGVALAARAVS